MSMPVNFSMRSVIDQLARQLWPPRCLVCGMVGDCAADRELCLACHAALPWNRHACCGCGLPLQAADGGALCGACLQRKTRPLEAVHAAFIYAAPLDRLLPRFKFHQSLPAGRLVAGLMADALQDIETRPEALLPIPLHRARLRQRGYDQALELAKPLSRALGIPLLRSALCRHKATAPQSQLDKHARQRNLRDAFRLASACPLPRHVALIDDVMTTGATLEAAARILRRAGVARIDAWVAARAV
ncbi:amidophosphoribosyltransferase [Lysobacteraceae bacterium NML03-0222]|nr:amidophosphoribosyltransferase [Xanthomonadaceae bacterium NML03-0222]